MTIQEYVKKLDEICKREFIPAVTLVRELGISHHTLLKLKRNGSCSMNTMRKIKMFVDKWEPQNMIGSD